MAGLINDAKEWVADEIANIPKPSADLTDVHIKHATTSAVQLKSDVTVTNPYDHELPLIEITYFLRSNDKEIASGTVSDVGGIAASAATVTEVMSEVSYDFLINLMKDIGSDWDIDYDFDVGVKVNLPIVGEFNIPLHKKGCIKLPTLSELL
ncbi:unnamed protein product [Sphagnum jensenii]|uniref:Water stress and hypersensitive response domain-containing protein n=1 Tax=Sphagnum jensenii TaxID=128206 RepID=A0ABP0XCH3_9BRYO